MQTICQPWKKCFTLNTIILPKLYQYTTPPRIESMNVQRLDNSAWPVMCKRVPDIVSHPPPHVAGISSSSFCFLFFFLVYTHATTTTTKTILNSGLQQLVVWENLNGTCVQIFHQMSLCPANQRRRRFHVFILLSPVLFVTPFRADANNTRVWVMFRSKKFNKNKWFQFVFQV